MRCPGQDSRYWKPEAVYNVPCSKCGSLMEFFKDEPTRRCKKCGHKMVNPKMDFGCAAYCKFAEQCLGDLPPESPQSWNFAQSCRRMSRPNRRSRNGTPRQWRWYWIAQRDTHAPIHCALETGNPTGRHGCQSRQRVPGCRFSGRQSERP